MTAELPLGARPQNRLLLKKAFEQRLTGNSPLSCFSGKQRWDHRVDQPWPLLPHGRLEQAVEFLGGGRPVRRYTHAPRERGEVEVGPADV